MIGLISKTLRKLRQLISDRNLYSIAYSQEGEDLILRRYFNNKRSGFYIDVGAHHPKRYSNTYLFYLRGWNGINIDAMPGSMAPFNIVRKRDINLEKAVSNKNQELTFYIFDDPAFNSFSKESAEEKVANSNIKIKDKVIIKTQTLSSILQEHLPPTVKTIDFMSIDVEGLDLEVLKSNDWEKYRPTFIWVELFDFESFENDPVFAFLKKNGYNFEAKTQHSFLFKDSNDQVFSKY